MAAPVTLWEPGRRFIATDAKLSMLFEKEPAIEAGDILIFEGLNPEISITGDTISVLSFRKGGNNGHQSGRDEYDEPPTEGDGEGTGTIPRRKVRARLLRYKVNVPPSQLSSSFTLPMSVDLNMVEEARGILTGKRYYIISPLRVDSTLTPTAGGRRYVPVTIDNVLAGNADYPLRLDITDDMGNQSSVAMTAGNARSATRNFDKIFQTDDPRLRYPAISGQVWDNIINSRVAKGMTTEECHLALGSPRDIRKWHNGGSFFESWTYDSGRYLIFEDGLLSVIH